MGKIEVGWGLILPRPILPLLYLYAMQTLSGLHSSSHSSLTLALGGDLLCSLPFHSLPLFGYHESEVQGLSPSAF